MESLYFRKMRAHCEKYHDRCYILSAKYILLEPHGQPIEPYDETRRNATVDEKREWARDVFSQLRAQQAFGAGTTLILYAGQDYYGKLLPLL